MNRVRVFICAGAGLAGVWLCWSASAVEDMSAGAVSRSAGLVLFAVATLAAALVFRDAMRADKLPAAKVGSLGSEFRRGFDKRGGTMNPPARGTSEQRVVVALRRAAGEEGPWPRTESHSVKLSADQVERLQDLLHRRAAALRARNAE